MKNPCEECLVSPMCKVSCEKMAKFMRDITSEEFHQYWNFRELARSVKAGNVILHRTGLKWTWEINKNEIEDEYIEGARLCVINGI